MNHFDAVDFSECHSEEVISFFWRSVYFIMICVLNQTLSLLHNYAPHIFYRLKVLMSMNQMDLKYRQLRARRALSPYTLYSNSALLVLNGTSLSCNNALLAVDWRYDPLKNNLSISLGPSCLQYSSENLTAKCSKTCTMYVTQLRLFLSCQRF